MSVPQAVDRLPSTIANYLIIMISLLLLFELIIRRKYEVVYLSLF